MDENIKVKETTDMAEVSEVFTLKDAFISGDGFFFDCDYDNVSSGSGTSSSLMIIM